MSSIWTRRIHHWSELLKLAFINNSNFVLGKRDVPSSDSVVLVMQTRDTQFLTRLAGFLSVHQGVRVLGVFNGRLTSRVFLSPLATLVGFFSGSCYRKVVVKTYGYFDIKSFEIGVVKRTCFAVDAFCRALIMQFEGERIYDRGYRFEDLEIGDLISGSVIRFFENPDLTFKRWQCVYFLFQAIYLKRKWEYLYSTLNIKMICSQYTSYVTHGVMVRCALKDGIQCYTFARADAAKKLSVVDRSHTPNFAAYQKYLDSFEAERVEQLRKASRSAWIATTRGDAVYSYLKRSSYLGSCFNERELRGVVFLHCFFDSQYDFSWSLFPTLFAWVDFTAQVITEHDLKIGFRLHPNAIAANQEVLDFFRLKFPKLIWIEDSVSLNSIMHQIDFGISVFGTVLSELSYHGKRAYALGSNPMESYPKTVRTIKSIPEYRGLLLNENEYADDFDHIQSSVDAINFRAVHDFLPGPNCVALQKANMTRTQVDELRQLERYG